MLIGIFPTSLLAKKAVHTKEQISNLSLRAMPQYMGHYQIDQSRPDGTPAWTRINSAWGSWRSNLKSLYHKIEVDRGISGARLGQLNSVLQITSILKEMKPPSSAEFAWPQYQV